MISQQGTVYPLASKNFPGSSRLYWLHEPGNGRAFRGRISLSLEDARAVTRAEKSVEQVELRWVMGATAPTDVVRTTSVVPIIVSDRVVDIFKVNAFSGWRRYSVELFDKESAPIPNYQGLAVHGRCGPIEDGRSEKMEKVYPGGVFPMWKGLYFDAATWDGSDFFMPAGNVGWIFVVEAVKQAFEKAKVKNVLFTPLAEVERESVRL